MKLSHSATIACSGKVLLRRRDDGGTDIEVLGARGTVRDERPTDVVAGELRSQGLNVTIW